MSDTNIVKNWSYPFKTAGESSKEVTDPQVYFDALAKAENGFYPMGKNGLWHGGVHFDDNTAALLDQSSIRCIADGEVIAYRIDQIYPETQYGAAYTPGTGPEALTAKYSTGFVLVKHLLELPPAPPPPPPSTSGATTPSTGAAPVEMGAETAPAPTSSEPTAAPERLTFYSLYMHLLDWTSYEANPALQRPAFWGAGLCKVKSDAPDKVRGLNVREHYKVDESNEHYGQYQNKLTTLPRGTRIETGEAAPSPNHNWRRLIRATPAVEGLAENTGWVYVLEAKELAENQYLVSEDKSKDVPAIEQIGLHVRESASGSSSVLAVLPRGTEIQVSGEGSFVKLEAIVSGNAIPPLTADAEGKLPGYVWRQSLEAQRSPNDLAKDKVYPLPTAQRIKAGELIGHMGLYQEYDQSAPKTRLHLEVFSCEDVPAFIEKSRARAESLPNDQKTLIMVDVGSTVYQPTPADTQIAAGHDVRPATDSPTEGRWVKIHPYVVLKAKKAGFGSFDGAHNRYPMDGDKRTELASEFDLDVSELPDTADFLLESYKEDGSNMYAGKTNIPSTHVRRKVGIKLNTPVWVKRNALNAQTRRSSTSSTLEAWKKFPLSQATDNGQTCGFERILSKASWNDLSADHKAIDADTQKSRWWYVTVANAAGQDISGWVLEADLIVTQCSPWDWPGFSYIEDSTTLVSQQAQTLNAQGVLSPEEARTYAAKIEEAEHGPIFQSLFKIIDQPNSEGIRDKELTPLEIKNALGQPWLAQQLSLLITHYESEWFWKDTTWNELDSLMTQDSETSNESWEKEKQRIKNLNWWAELDGFLGDNSDGKAWHFQPNGLISNFFFANCCIPLEKAQEISLLVTTGFEGPSALHYGALADNFDGQGMSFGVIQWNFGQGTLGPVLNDMRSENETTFDACFGENMNYEDLIASLESGNNEAQKDWAVNIQAINNSGWREAFHNLGEIAEFQKIQLKHAAKYHNNVEKCIRMMRELSVEIMEHVELLTYVALYDLCVQQNNLDAARESIFSTYPTESISTQKQLLTFVCTQRAHAANSAWVSDCLSRRLGIIQGSTYTSTANGVTKAKSNPNFNLVIEGIVCEI